MDWAWLGMTLVTVALLFVACLAMGGDGNDAPPHCPDCDCGLMCHDKKRRRWYWHRRKLEDRK